MYQVVEDFEKAIAEYTGAKYACVVTSCSFALLLACDYLKVEEVTIPKKTYVSVPQSIIHAGGTVKFEENETWQEDGFYQLKPYPIWDFARLLTSGMHKKNQFECISFHWGKTLNLGQGGAILTDDKEAYEWFKRARFDGRTQGVSLKTDKFIMGWHCYMSPQDAADGLTRLHFLPKHNKPLSKDDYRDLSKCKIFKPKLTKEQEYYKMGGF